MSFPLAIIAFSKTETQNINDDNSIIFQVLSFVYVLKKLTD